jgi:hypothetical protein
LRGLDVIPRLGVSSIRETFDFCKDALEDLFHRRSDPFDRYGSAWPGWRTGSGSGPRGGGRYGYDTVPATRDEEEAILGEDSEDDEEEEQRPAAPRPPQGPQPAGPSPWNDQANVPQQTQSNAAAPTRQPPAGMDSSGVIKL